MSSPLATVGILSIGEMGLGIGKLLIAHGYQVVTNITGRSEDTRTRAIEGQIELLSSDQDLIKYSDYMLSIVPPRDALVTAQRVATALREGVPKTKALYYLDLNAISPRSAREVAAVFDDHSNVTFIDGGIIGGPPRQSTDSTPKTGRSSNPESGLTGNSWSRPSIPCSGPYELSKAPISGAHLESTLNIKHVSPDVGSASGLKCCFASTTKGFTALAIQSFTTAQTLGVLPELKQHLQDFTPAQFSSVLKGVSGMAPKAYRWVREMEEIAATHAEEGGFERTIFDGIAEVYKTVAEDTVLGEEKTERRKRGTTVEDVAIALTEGFKAKRTKR